MIIFTCLHNCVLIFWFATKNAKNLKILKKKSFNEFYLTYFWQDYFLHMWLAPKAKHFEPIGHNVFAKWVFKWVFCLPTISFKISKFWNFVWFGFSLSSFSECVLS
jgi:hypothetical protein